MAQYKVPQDVEADDKLIGPFSFRQFVYLLIVAGLIALAVGLFQIFPVLAILPLPPVLLFLALALPIKKDQPMETYLAALVSYYLKPRTKKWTPGQRESTILITAPKIVEDVRTRDISEEEATHRLSFLANIVDTQGYAIRGVTNSIMRDDLAAEANAMNDMFDNYRAINLGRAAAQEKAERHEEVIREMREAIDRNESFIGLNKNIQTDSNLAVGAKKTEPESEKKQTESVIVMPDVNTSLNKKTENVNVKPPKNSIIELANNSDYSIQTIAKEANRINGKDEGEVYIALH